MELNQLKQVMDLAKDLQQGKYFYYVGEADEDSTYYDSDSHNYMPDSRTVGRGWKSDLYNTLEEAIDALIDEGYGLIDQKFNFPKDINYLEDIEDESVCTLKEIGNNEIELLSFSTVTEEEFGSEYQEETLEVSREIQICKLKTGKHKDKRLYLL